MKMQLEVIKADGTVEQYLHTKVMGAINNALSEIGRSDVAAAEELAEVVTYYLYHNRPSRRVCSNEILSVIKAVLSSTGYPEAAAALSEHYYQRKLKRSRIEVLPIDVQDLDDVERLFELDPPLAGSAWDKNHIVEHLVTRHDLPRQTARAIASMVEEKVFNLGLTRLPTSLVKQLVLGEAAAILRAQHQLV